MFIKKKPLAKAPQANMTGPAKLSPIPVPKNVEPKKHNNVKTRKTSR